MKAERMHVCLVAALLLSASTPAAGPRRDEAAGQAEALRLAFDLAEVRVGGIALRYEKTLRPREGALRATLADFLKKEAGYLAPAALLRKKADQAVRQVNKIVGFSPDDKQRAEQRELLLGFLRLTESFRLGAPDRKTTLYVITQESSKDYLRKGGTLPGFTYDKARDKATYVFKYGRYSRSASRPGKPPGMALVIPVGADAPEKELAKLLKVIGKVWLSPSAGMSLHELAEHTMLNRRLKPFDPHFRWFSDGFANAIAVQVLGTLVDRKAAAEFAARFDPAQYSVPKQNVNLRYWLGADFEVAAPIESEEHLSKARYCHATQEAVRLVEAHGIGCVAKILDAACKKESGNSSADLISAVKEVTGEDIENRLLSYQSFRTAQEGIKQYTKAFRRAYARDDHAPALRALLRLMELHAGAERQHYAVAAYLLFRMGHEGAGDRAILRRAALCRRRGLNDAYVGMHALFIDYSLMCNRLAKAQPSAEIVLKARPQYVGALAVRMHKLRVEGKRDQAAEIARRILELDKGPNSPWRRLAKRALGGKP